MESILAEETPLGALLEGVATTSILSQAPLIIS